MKDSPAIRQDGPRQQEQGAHAGRVAAVSASEDAEAKVEMLEVVREKAEPQTSEIRIVDSKVDNGKPRPFSFGRHRGPGLDCL